MSHGDGEAEGLIESWMSHAEGLIKGWMSLGEGEGEERTHEGQGESWGGHVQREARATWHCHVARARVGEAT